MTLSSTTTTATATVAIGSTVAQVKSAPVQAGLGGWGLKGGAMLAALLCLVPFRRRRFFRSLAGLTLLAIGLTAMSGCGGGGNAPTPKKSSAGTYTVTVNAVGTPTAYSTPFNATTSFTLTIN